MEVITLHFITVITVLATPLDPSLYTQYSLQSKLAANLSHQHC